MHDPVTPLYQILEDYTKTERNKGAAIFRKFQDEITLTQEGTNYLLEVPSESSNLRYDIILELEEHMDECTCPAYDKYGHCKHVPAAIFYALVHHLGIPVGEVQIKWTVDLGIPAAMPGKSTTVIQHPLSDIELPGWKNITALPPYLPGQISVLSRSAYANYNLKRTVKVQSTDERPDGMLHWAFSVKDNLKPFLPEIIYNRRDTYYYRCTCKQKSVVCSHVQAVLEALLDKEPTFFSQHRDWRAEKAKLLQPYGLKPDDPDARLFEFNVTAQGSLSIKQPSFIWQPGATDQFKQLKSILAIPESSRPTPSPNIFIDFEIGFLLNFTTRHFNNGFELEPIKLSEKKGKPVFGKLSLHQPDHLNLLTSLPAPIHHTLTQLSDQALKKWALQHVNQFYLSNLLQLSAEHTTQLETHYFQQLQQLWSWLAGQQVFVLETGKFSADTIIPATVSAAIPKPCFYVKQEGHYISVELHLQKEDQVFAPGTYVFRGGMLVQVNNVFYLPQPEDRSVLRMFDQGFIRIHEADKARLVQEIIPLLQQRYPVDVPEQLRIETRYPVPQPRVMLQEYKNQHLVLQPQFDYEGTIVAYDPAPAQLLQPGQEGKIQCLVRDTAAETDFFESLRPLHPAFGRQRLNPFFYLPFDEVMKHNWFLNTVRQLQSQHIPVLGIQQLEHFRYNTATPRWEIKAGSGIDWFDLKIEVYFGDQTVPLTALRKAVLQGDNVVVLGDGTLGVLPEEWLEQYGMLLKMGEARKDGTLRISKLHYTLIDELHSQIDDEDVLREIEEKKQQLRHIGQLELAPPSTAIQARHRPYQLSGFQWMQVLDAIGWGGCLADDMGLGKTLQTITFLQYLKEKHTGSTHLVICPTSLIYNWQAELEKFAPALHYHIYYGPDRAFGKPEFKKCDLVLTSYGTLRLDIQQLMRFQWHYVVLDESQAIKNPDTQVTKALQLLKSRNRLILSGTPVQNNTYDLYAQFNFINPGLLGSRDFFKTEFANPIDKNNDALKSSQLRRLIYPFLLRRTKQQVATDLPDKTEMVLWCEMPKEQRAVYNYYKDYYRNMLLQKIEEEGMTKAGMYVLEGLLRLRQICDSPELLKDETVKTKASIKTEELLREIEENSGGHKLLVFSQFTEMLALIRRALEKDGISYSYLDGSTPADKRRQAVEKFQTDPDDRVFLISLKAGGVGLNLTAADYVYLMDPWWNPAVEQQAIDRTHRIGQTQKIFAYKMICKDTVEEKILELQDRKKQLANELVTEDAGFIKKLTKDDVAFLFS